MVILITGGLGYLGSRLAEYLSNRGDRIRISTRRDADRIPDWANDWDVRPMNAWNVPDLKNLLDGVEAVVHLAKPDAQRAAANPSEALNAGGEQTWNLLQAVADTDETLPFLNISSIFVYGPRVEGVITEDTPTAPEHPYAVGHRIAEIVTHRFFDIGAANTLNVRLSNCFGRPVAPDAAKWSLVFNDLCRQAVRDGVLRLNTPGTQQKNFVTLEDGLRALHLLLNRMARWPKDRIIHVGGNETMSILQVAERVADRYELLFGARPEIRRPSPPKGESWPDFQFDCSRLKSIGFSWNHPIDLEIDGTLKACQKWKTKK